MGRQTNRLMGSTLQETAALGLFTLFSADEMVSSANSAPRREEKTSFKSAQQTSRRLEYYIFSRGRCKSFSSHIIMYTYSRICLGDAAVCNNAMGWVLKSIEGEKSVHAEAALRPTTRTRRLCANGKDFK